MIGTQVSGVGVETLEENGESASPAAAAAVASAGVGAEAQQIRKHDGRKVSDDHRGKWRQSRTGGGKREERDNKEAEDDGRGKRSE